MSKKLTVDIDRYQALADKCDGLEYQVELQAKRIAELEHDNKTVLLKIEDGDLGGAIDLLRYMTAMTTTKE
jgi:hypothetical protein